MSTPITTADVLPFTWGGYTYTAKQELPIICEPSPHLARHTIASCKVFEWGYTWRINWELGRANAIESLRYAIHNRCQHYLLADDSALTPEGLSKKRQLDELFTITKQ